MGFYVVSDDKCFYEGMTKEQILTAITQAISTHQISDVDTGFVTTLKEANQNKPMSFWIGTTAEYNAIEEKLDDCVYLLTDDTELEDLEALIRRSMNVLKGEVILDATSNPIAFSGTTPLGIQQTGEHKIWEFTMVSVEYVIPNKGSGICLCRVQPVLSNGEPSSASVLGDGYIGRGFSDATDPSMVQAIISLTFGMNSNTGKHVLMYNFSTLHVFNDPAEWFENTGLSIKKIVGVM